MRRDVGPSHRSLRVIAALAPLAIAGASIAQAAVIPRLAGVRADYVLYCAGCHGINGEVGNSAVAPLRGRVGRLLCSEEGRRFVGRLPNLAAVRGVDGARMAALVNFVMFDLGGDSAPHAARGYTADEIARLRAAPLTRGNLARSQSAAWRSVARACSG